MRALVINEKKLSSEDRENCTDWGLPELKKYPMPDPEYVTYAIIYFNKVDKEHEKELAQNIIKYIKKYKMNPRVSDDNRFSKYWNN